MPAITTKPALVQALAERVMGWTVHERGEHEITYYDGRVYWFVVLCGPDCGDPMRDGGWDPTENIADAFMLVEARRKEGDAFALEADEAQVPWFAMFGDHLSRGQMADTAPLAVSLAAAAAVGLEVRLA